MTTPNRFGEHHIRPDYYEDKSGMRHPLVEDLEHSIAWSQDTRSEASHENHSGKPEYMRSDDRIYSELSETLKASPELEASEIGVKVENGIVTLLGRTSGRVEKRVAEMISGDIPGVLEVRNEIVIPE